MKRNLWLSLTTLFLLTVLGIRLGIAKSLNSASHVLLAHEPRNEASSEHSSGEGMHQHKIMEISSTQPVPAVDLIVHPDAVKGVNLEVKLSNFKFAPEKVNQDSKPTEGHAHLYVDGEKLTRLYGNWYYLGNLAPGQHKITVTLNANLHEDLVYQGKKIEDSEIISIPAKNN